jgi:D-serine dehydratase
MPKPLKHFRRSRDAIPTPLPSAQDPPRATAAGGWEMVAVNDQHAQLVLPPAADVCVGDMIALGVSHPCTTFDKWRLLYVVDDQYRVRSAIRTFF